MELENTLKFALEYMVIQGFCGAMMSSRECPTFQVGRFQTDGNGHPWPIGGRSLFSIQLRLGEERRSENLDQAD